MTSAGEDKELKEFWGAPILDLEGLRNPEHRKIEEHYRKSTIITPEGRFQVRIPFRDVNKKDIAKNAGRALAMFRRLEETMKKDSNLAREYHKAMAKDFINGHLREVEYDEVKAFIPHHGVWKDSTSTKLRMVMNFSASEPNKMSVNEACMSGPTIQKPLLATLIQFSTGRYATSGDVTQMYKQVQVHPKDQLWQCFPWRSKENDRIRYYAYKVLTFGHASSAYMAIRTLLEIADREAANFPIGTSFIKDNMYVDDLEISMNDPKMLLTGLIQTREALKKYKFVMTKWKSNIPEIVEALGGDQQPTTVLGMKWNPKTDEMGFVWHPQPVGDVTMRKYLSDVQQLFDPLGLLSPVTIR